MGKIADPLRERILRFEELGIDKEYPLLIQTLEACANQIDRDHEQRIWQCEHEVRRRLCRDVRWAVNLLEDKCSRRQIRKRIDEC